MIKHCIQQPANIGYKNARSLLEQKYGNTSSIIAAYRKEIKTWPQLKPADGVAFQKLHNFLIKYESANLWANIKCSCYTRNDVSSIIQTTRTHKGKVEQKCHVHPEEVLKRS